jgi:integral membrane protein
LILILFDHFITEIARMYNRIKYFRIVAITEGISFLVLLLIAMPLKYYANIPEAVKVVGWAHGILFIAYVGLLLICIQPLKWNWFKVIVAFCASLLPFGTFVLDKELKRKQTELSL